MEVNREQGHFTNKRQQKLRYAAYVPAGVAKAVYVAHGGIREHIDFSQQTYSKIASGGYVVFQIEPHGHGRSEPLEPPHIRFTTKSFFDFSDDYIQFIDEVVKEHAGVKGKNLPIFIGGNSMGGLLSAIVAVQKQKELQGLLLTCPAIDVDRNIIMNIQELISEVLVRLFPYKRMVPAIPVEKITGEADVRERIEKDDLIEKGPVAIKTGYEFLRGFKYVRQHEQELTLPLVVIVGTQDEVVCYKALDRFLGNVQSKDATLVKVEGGYHHLLDGAKADEYVRIMVEWMNDHLQTVTQKSGL
eukprot:TRINITY_DN6798_c0_g1_i1.p1 TRINITY_DN6798_c0_g1~~TRINITY_DN6798_c0_g1_i1.p1  ORF type:complete len:301 (+),score=35.32 TRINITY_DN6798_c0_g1_i1:58-960(+)